MTNDQLVHLVGLADDLRKAQRAYMSNRSDENGKAVGKASAAYDDARRRYEDGAGDPRVVLLGVDGIDMEAVEAKLYEWANNDGIATRSVVETILRLASEVQPGAKEGAEGA